MLSRLNCAARCARPQKEHARLGFDDFEERYARWLKPGSFRVFEQLDVNSDRVVDSEEIRKLRTSMAMAWLVSGN